MVSFIGFLFIYVIGGITFLPFLAFAALVYIKGPRSSKKIKKEHEEAYVYKDPDNVIVKKGWIRLINQYQPKMPEVIHSTTAAITNNSNNNGSGIISGIQSYVNNVKEQKKGIAYAVLKHGTLFCYESENQQEVIMILPMQEFRVSLYPTNKPDKNEGAIYDRTAVIRLIPNSLESTTLLQDINNNSKVCTLSEEDITFNPSRILYLTCDRNTDKEDWYLGLIDAQHMLTNNNEECQYVMMDNTHFNSFAMEQLISQVQSSPSHRETAWINAIFGRIFLGMYKTDRLKNFVEMKIRKKIDRTKRPTFLDEITVRKVDIGQSVPFITDPKLLSLSPQGEVIVEVKVEYHGGLTIEIETDFNWSYSSRMKPIRMHLILAVKLRKLAGRLMFKLKAPPTNRYWLAFFEMPEMDWEITPVVADKQIKLNIVTSAIESRIREVMADTFVLPNMDDTSFCPTGGKGGIFGEYIKVERREPKKSTHVNLNDDDDDIKHLRKNSVSSEESSHHRGSMVREPPTVPVTTEKLTAADTLKLKNRRAESANEFAPTGGNRPASSDVTPAGGSHSQKLEISHSTPDIYFTPHSNGGDNESIKSGDQKSITDSTTTNSDGSSKWSAAGIRKRLTKSTIDEDNSSDDTESATLGKSGNGLLSKITSLLPTTDNGSHSTSDTLSVRSGTQNPTTSTTNSNDSNNNKRSSLLQRAENFLGKKIGGNNQDEHLSEEKKEIYAERLANMRRRAEKKRLSTSTNSIPPPPLTPLLPYSQLPSATTKSLLDDDDDTNTKLQPPIKPHRERAASTAHQDSTQPPLPPRHNSTPVTVSKNLVSSPPPLVETSPFPDEFAFPVAAAVSVEEASIPVQEEPFKISNNNNSPPAIPDKSRPQVNSPDLPTTTESPIEITTQPLEQVEKSISSPPVPPRHHRP